MATGNQAPILDIYAPLSHKQVIASTGTEPDNGGLAPTWVGEDNRRRLTAYLVLHAYESNVARLFLPTGKPIFEDDPDRPGVKRLVDWETAEPDERREFGDAALLVERIKAGVLGDETTVVVDGADTDLPDAPLLPPRPSEPEPSEEGGTVDRIDQASFEAQLRVWEAAADAAIDEWEELHTAQPALRERQAWLRAWAELEGLRAKMDEAEGDAILLGDGVYVLRLDREQGRPTVEVYDPGFYFPVLDDRPGFPRRVHVAWEFEQPDAQGRTKRWVRRLTWETGPIRVLVDDDGLPLFDDSGALVVRDGDTLTDDGRVTRRYPWAPDVDSTETVYFTDATWELTGATGRGVDTFDVSEARFAATSDGLVARDLDLVIDFIPVVHIPNTPASRTHFGQSSLAAVLQVLDELQATDSDMAAAREYVGAPMLALSGKLSPKDRERVEPGMIYYTGENGSLDAVDVSAGVVALAAVIEGLLDRLSVNGRVPAEVLGRVKDAASDLAGITVLLRFGPYTQLVQILRLTRKYGLLLKFAQRLAQAGFDPSRDEDDQDGMWLPPGDNPAARVAFGSHLPSDRTAVVDLVMRLLEKHGIARRTALRLLADAGIDVGDIREEIDLIEREDTASAVEIADATGSEQLAAERLGLEIPDGETQQTPVAPIPPIDQQQ